MESGPAALKQGSSPQRYFVLPFFGESCQHIMVHQVIGAIATGIGLLTEPGLCFEGLQNGFEKNWKQFCDLPSRN